MSEATMTAPATVNPVPTGIMVGEEHPETDGMPPRDDPLSGESAAPPDLYAVKMTADR